MTKREAVLWAGKVLQEKPWKYAKTMPKFPHWYTLRRAWEGNDQDFNRVIELIRQHGYAEKFFRRSFTMLNINEFKYWECGEPVEVTPLINRTFRKLPSVPYDAIAPVYDSLFTDAQSLEENAAVMARVGDLTGLSVLDVGCGTGLLLDYLKPYTYLGIDPSENMLSRFREKHPRYADSVLQCGLEDYAGWGFDVVVALFGTASYIEPEAVESIPSLCGPGGRWVVMFYKADYRPVTHEKSGVRVPYYPPNTNLPGARSDFGSFVLVEGGR